jgi:hypothetical protein
LGILALLSEKAIANAIAIFTEKQLIFPYTSKTVFRLLFTTIWICFYRFIGKNVPRKSGDRHQIATELYGF